MPVENGAIEADVERDVLKAFVFERHNATKTHGCGLVSGFGIKGAFAQTVAHDAHNLLVVEETTKTWRSRPNADRLRRRGDRRA